MERCSYFIPDKALFGSFPSQQTVDELEGLGVRCFIDLTGTTEEKITPYHTRYKYIKYPIIDRHIPQDWRSFAQLIVEICNVIKSLGPDEKLYIHCKGGHGRSGILVACILCYYHGIDSDEALRQTAHYHSKRPEMREKWRKLGSPQGKRQRDFVHRFFRQLYYDTNEKNTYTAGFSNSSPHSVTTELGTFPNAYCAFQAYRDEKNIEYVRHLRHGRFCPEVLDRENLYWDENKIDYMTKVLDYKFRQHKHLRYTLMNTGLRPLIKVSPDSFWGHGGNGQGHNAHGRILMALRLKYLQEDFHHSLLS